MDVAAQRLTYLTDTSGTSEMAQTFQICFTPDSSMVLIAVHTCSGARLEVHSRNAQRLHRIRPEEADNNLAMVCLTSLQAAVTSDFNGFTVWDLLTSQQLHAVKLHEEKELDSDDEEMVFPTVPSLLCADKFGTRLAYVESDSVIVHLFDAATLQPLGTLNPPDIVTSQQGISHLNLGVSSFLLTPYSERWNTRVVHLCRLEEDPAVLQTLMHIEPNQAPVHSEDAAFFACICKGGAATIKVFDSRSGDLVLAHEAGLQDAKAESMVVTWIHSSLLITARVRQAGSCKTTDHITVLQL